MTPIEIFDYASKHEEQWYCPGVYFVMISEYPNMNHRKMVYIGSSKNMRKRVNGLNHIHMKLMNRLSPNYITFCYYFKCEKYREVEIKCINYFKPFFNKTFKNG